MAQKKPINDEIFEVMLRGALITKYQNEAADAQAGAEAHEYSEKFRKNIKKIRNSINRTDNIKTAFKAMGKALVSAAAVIGVISGVLLTQPKIYAAVREVFRSVFDDHDKLLFSESGDVTIENFKTDLCPSYLPEGYYFDEGWFCPISVVRFFKNYQDDEAELMFDYGIADGMSISIDNEGHSYSEIVRDGQTYYFYEADEPEVWDILIWYKDGYSFTLYGNISPEELIRTAESVEIPEAE